MLMFACSKACPDIADKSCIHVYTYIYIYVLWEWFIVALCLVLGCEAIAIMKLSMKASCYVPKRRARPQLLCSDEHTRTPRMANAKDANGP